MQASPPPDEASEPTDFTRAWQSAFQRLGGVEIELPERSEVARGVSFEDWPEEPDR